MPSSNLPSASGARLAGDDYQHVFTWLMAMRCLVRGADVERVDFEIRGTGNVDDVVVHVAQDRPTYHQIKFVVDQREPLTWEWFITSARDRGASPLERFYKSYIKLGGPADPPKMILYTNRSTASGDPLMKYVGGIDERLVPRALVPADGSETGRARAAWAEHLGIDAEELGEFLGALHIRAGEQSLRTLQERCQENMAMLGLKSDAAAVLAAVGALRGLIEEGRTSLDRAAVEGLVTAMGLPAAPPRATLLLQCLARDPWPDAATAAVDWVPLFDGDEPPLRRQLRDPDAWEHRLRPELRAAVASLQAEGYDRVLVTGTYRLSVATLAGAELPRVAGFEVARMQGPTEEWSSAGGHAVVGLDQVERDLGDGEEVAIALAVSAQLADDVEAFCREHLGSVGRLIILAPQVGVGRRALPDADAARGLVEELVGAIRSVGRSAMLTHLFQAAPSGLSLLLGHAWNRMPETQLYDDLNSAAGYTPTFRLRA